MNSAGNNSVTHLLIGEEEQGQRLDNFLIRRCKGVPKSHIYRILRSGEVRVNSGRVDATYRLCAGDKLRIPPIRIAERPRTRSTRSPSNASICRSSTRTRPCWSSTSPKASRCTAAAASVSASSRRCAGSGPQAKFPRTGASPRPRDLRHPAGRQEAPGADCLARHVPRTWRRRRQALPGAGQGALDECHPARQGCRCTNT
jgi:hypothetical protein